MRSFFYKLDTLSYDAVSSENKQLQNLCYDVKDFILEGTFTRYKKVKTILSYWGHPDNYVTKMTNMKESTVRVARRNLSNELYELFGYDFFEVVRDGDDKSISEGRARLSLAKRGFHSENFLYRELIDTVRSKALVEDDINITSCANEIQFLLRHSKQNIEKELSHLDLGKLLYLIRMLDNETGSITNIYNLIKCFEREV